MLDLLDKRNAIGCLGPITNLQFDEDVLADGTREQVFDLLPIDLQIRGSVSWRRR